MNPETLYHRALEDFRAGALDAAAKKLRDILSAAPSFEDAYEALSVIYFNQKRYPEAVTILKAWAALNPDALMAHTNLSRCYAAQGLITEAEYEQSEARRLTWKAELRSKKSDLPKIDHEARIRRFKQVIEFDPADVLGYFSLGTAYAEAGFTREAMETFRKAIEVDPSHASSYLGLGLALEGLGDLGKAGEIYRNGIRAADRAGDIMPLKKMEARLRAIEKPGEENRA